MIESNIVRLPTTADSPAANLEAFISGAQRSPALKGVLWDSWVWEVSDEDPCVRVERGHKSLGRRIIFADRESSEGKGAGRRALELRSAMREPYLSFAKAEVRRYANDYAPSMAVIRKRINAHQFIESAARTAGIRDVPEITNNTFREAAKLVAQQMNGSNRYRMCNVLAAISAAVDRFGLTHAKTQYANEHQRPLDGDELTEEGQKAGAAKMVSDEVLSTLGELSNNPPDVESKLILRIVDLLLVGGFRIGEVLALPVDCSIEAPDLATANPATGEMFRPLGLLYVPEKKQEYSTKWVSRASIELARRAVDDLTALCKPAREMARWMEENPGRLKPFADLDPDQEIWAREAAERLGLAKSENWRQPPVNLPGERRGGRMYHRVRDIENLYYPGAGPFDVLVMPSGRRQRLSESLIVVSKHQFHGNRPSLLWLPQMLGYEVFQGALSPSGTDGGRKGILPETMRAKSHAFRHWLNTLADSGGLTDIELAKWMGRKELTQNLPYKHGTMQRRIDQTRELVRTGQTFGQIDRVMSTLPVAEREPFLDAAIEAVHVMPVGLCVHNYASSPCEIHHQCLRGCGDYLRVKGDQEQRDALLDLERRERAALEHHRKALCDGCFGVDKWIEQSEEHLNGIAAALAADDRSDAGAGVPVPVFEGAETKNRLLK